VFRFLSVTTLFQTDELHFLGQASKSASEFDLARVAKKGKFVAVQKQTPGDMISQSRDAWIVLVAGCVASAIGNSLNPISIFAILAPALFYGGWWNSSL
jgi:hypothetical protein